MIPENIYDGQPSKILIVDDKPENIFAMENILKSVDSEVFNAQSGDEALSKMLRHDFALALLDVQMPGMDGFELAELMRSNKKTRSIPIIFVTAISKEMTHVFKGYEAGAVDYLLKPLNPEILKHKVKIFLTLDRQKKLLELTARELDEKNQILQKSKRDAEIANKAKSEFLANMSHEIRTPMNAVLGLTYLILKTKLSQKQRDYMTKIRASAEALLGIINDILDFSKIEAGKLHIESIKFHLDQVFHNIATVVAHPAEMKELEFLISVDRNVPQKLIGDPLRLGQILINLVNNSIKFTSKGEILIKTEFVEGADSQAKLKFSVHDTGIGMSPVQTANLFQPFSQADGSTTRKYGGTGLGLSISKRLVELMDGDIWVESHPRKGSSFFFTAWFGLHNGTEKPYEKTIPDLSKLRGMVVDDNKTARKIMVRALTDIGVDATAVCSGEECLIEMINSVNSNPYDFILMDWKMPPGMDGIEVTKRIKEAPELAGNMPKVVMITAYGREEIQYQASEAGIDYFLLKPVSRSLLLDTLMDLYGKADKTQPLPPTDKSDIPDFQGVKVLLVEDHEINQQVASELLMSAGIQVTIAENGVEAVKMVFENQDNWTYDAVLMDVQMPYMDGYEATRKIRADSRFKDLPIIGLTAHALTEERKKCMDSGMNDHVSKPINPNGLFAALSRWIKDSKTLPQPAETAIEDETQLPELAGINKREGLNRVAGNISLYKKLLRRFVKGQTKTYDLIRQALSDGNLAEAERLAHNLKGIAGNLGAVALQEASADLEAAIRTGKEKAISIVLEKFSGQLKETLDVLSMFKQSTKKAEQKYDRQTDFESLLPRLGKLKSYLKEDNTAAGHLLNEIINDLSMAMDEDAILINQLEESVTQYDFDGALKILEHLVKIVDKKKRKQMIT